MQKPQTIQPEQAIILAAGLGTRMGKITQVVPKPLLQINGKTLIEYHILKLVQAGVTHIVVNNCHLGHLIEKELGDGSRFGVRIHHSAEGEKPLDTGGGIIQALPLLEEAPFWVVNADIYSDFDFHPLSLPDLALACLLLVANPPHNTDGDFHLADGILDNHQTPRLCYSGIGIYRPQLFASLAGGERPLSPLLRQAAAAGKLAGEYYTGLWMDIGTPERWQQAKALLQHHHNPVS